RRRHPLYYRRREATPRRTFDCPAGRFADSSSGPIVISAAELQKTGPPRRSTMKRSILLLILTALILVPTIAQAQKPIPLEPTKYGETLNANGEAMTEWLPREKDKAIEVFTLAVHADVANRE